MKNMYLQIGFGFVTLWDTVTTVYGTNKIIGNGAIGMTLSVLFAILLAAYLIHTIPILKNPSEEFVPVGAKILWFLAILYDLYTSFTGNLALILNNGADISKIIVAVGLTIFVCSGPIGLSYMRYSND